MKKSKDDIQGFWFGYIDAIIMIMSIFLILYIYSQDKNNKNSQSMKTIKDKIDSLQNEVNMYKDSVSVTVNQLNKIHELQQAIEKLPKEYFTYQPEYKRFKLNKQIQFKKYDYKIKPDYYAYLLEVGKEIENLINELHNDPNYKKYEIKYLIVIEGMASKDSYKDNFRLSYQRALSLYRLWKANGINFEDAEKCEIQIAGSGTDGIREFTGNYEYKNQQFLIHIIPKIGKITD